ncbi:MULTISPECIES: TnpV protein [Coprococcus]|nr:TnpV protein [Coprococcus ammoniilyticus]
MKKEVQIMELTYSKEGDYLIPNIEANEEPEESLTKYGMLRETFLKEHHKGIYTGKLLSGTLTEHCLMVQKQAEERFERLKNQMMESEEVTEELKSRDQMEWVRQMNSIANRADEIVLSEIVYSL